MAQVSKKGAICVTLSAEARIPSGKHGLSLRTESTHASSSHNQRATLIAHQRQPNTSINRPMTTSLHEPATTIAKKQPPTIMDHHQPPATNHNEPNTSHPSTTTSHQPAPFQQGPFVWISHPARKERRKPMDPSFPAKGQSSSAE